MPGTCACTHPSEATSPRKRATARPPRPTGWCAPLPTGSADRGGEPTRTVRPGQRTVLLAAPRCSPTSRRAPALQPANSWAARPGARGGGRVRATHARSAQPLLVLAEHGLAGEARAVAIEPGRLGLGRRVASPSGRGPGPADSDTAGVVRGSQVAGCRRATRRAAAKSDQRRALKCPRRPAALAARPSSSCADSDPTIYRQRVNCVDNYDHNWALLEANHCNVVITIMTTINPSEHQPHTSSLDRHSYLFFFCVLVAAIPST